MVSHWQTDFGFGVSYERQFGRLKVSTGPRGQVVSNAQTRMVGNEFRYSYDANLSYMLDDHLGLGMRLWRGNTVIGSDGTCWIGITYTK